jgi:hypothetical protein
MSLNSCVGATHTLRVSRIVLTRAVRRRAGSADPSFLTVVLKFLRSTPRFAASQGVARGRWRTFLHLPGTSRRHRENRN